MKKNRQWVVALSIIAAFFLISLAIFLGRELVASAETSNGTIYYFPMIAKNYPAVTLSDAWTGDLNKLPKTNYYFGDPITYVSRGMNYLSNPIGVKMSWVQENDCGITEIFSDTVSLPPGEWTHVYTYTIPLCAGTHTNTLTLNYGSYTATLAVNFEASFFSGIVVNTQQGFDTCNLPTVNQMQVWWDKSPYVVYNIYIGGVLYACRPATVNASWMQTVAQQGWDFILTWVGPQAPCTTYNYRISYDTSTAYSQGIDEAAAALAKAESLGLSGEKILYYDMEKYTHADPSIRTACRNAVDAFLAGWIDWIRLQDDKAGVYGSPCYYMMDWWSEDLEDRPDDVWIASWYPDPFTYVYNPDATVWDIACRSSVPDTYWPGQQRLRQYAGGHLETWGNVGLPIDSNVLNGEITAITNTLPASSPVNEASLPVPISGQIRDIDLITPDFGWVLQDGRLLFTSDRGESWKDISTALGDSVVLDVEFLDKNIGWIVARSFAASPEESLTIFQTRDGGFTWNSSLLPLDDLEIAAAYLEFINPQNGWLSLKLPTSINFSIGRLFATQDGGQTWEERTIPLGDPVRFVDELHGWVAGGPAGDQLFYTEDGGLTWQVQPLTDLPAGQIFVGLPEFENSSDGILPVTVLASSQPEFMLYKTTNGGSTWTLLDSLLLDAEPGMALPFSIANGDWWAASPGTSELMRSPGPESYLTNVTKTSLPTGIVLLDFSSQQVGWALVQDGVCQGDKIPFGQAVPMGAIPFECRLMSRIFVTQDGGLNWTEITP